MRERSRVFRKEFFITLFIKQNKWHKYGVLLHTFAVVCHAIKNKKYSMIMAALLHDIAKPYMAFQDEDDKKTDQYSFPNHEEGSYFLIKKWPISEYTKKLVRYHYLVRGMQKAKQKKQLGKYRRLNRIYNRLDNSFKKELLIFMSFDDKGKNSF